MGFGGGGYMDSGEEPEDLTMVVPSIPGIKAGLIFSRIIDTKEVSIDLDTQTIQATGLIGSTLIDDRVVMFPDIFSVLAMSGVADAMVNPFDGTGLNALVVDDTPFLRALTASYLAGSGFNATQVRDAHQALTLMKNRAFDLLVVDLSLPGMDAFELVSEMGGTPNRDIPMIGTTSSISVQLEQKCLAAGFVACVPTIDKIKLLEAIGQLQRV